MPASSRVMSANEAMPASCSWRVVMTVAESGLCDSGTSPKPATLAALALFLPLTVMVWLSD